MCSKIKQVQLFTSELVCGSTEKEKSGGGQCGRKGDLLLGQENFKREAGGKWKILRSIIRSSDLTCGFVPS